MQSSLRFILFTCAFVLCSSLPGQMLLGPGKVIFQKFENCDPPMQEIDLTLTQRKHNRSTSVIDMILSSPWPISDDMIMEINCEVKGDGGYKPGSFYLKGPFCTTLKSLIGDLFNAILEAVGVDDCPIPGEAKVNNFYLDSEKLNDRMLYGERRAVLKFFIDNEVKGCYLIYINLVPYGD